MKHKLVFFFFFLAVLVILSFGVTPGYYNAAPPNENDNTTSLLGKILYGVNNGVVTSGSVTLSGSSEVVTPRTLTTGTLNLSSNTTRFEFLVSQDFAASYITSTGTTAVSGSGTIAYGIFGNRAAPGRTLGVSTIVITSGSGSGYDAH